MKNFPRQPDRDYSISNAELAIRTGLWDKDIYGADYNYPFYKLVTSADFYFEDVKLAIFIDGEQVHRNKEFEDEEKRALIKGSPYGCIVRSYSYKAPITKKRLKEIVDAIVDDVTGLRRMNK